MINWPIQTPFSNSHSFHQDGDLVLNDTAVYAAIVELLLELEGVDPEPDFWTRSNMLSMKIVHNNNNSRFRFRQNTVSTLTSASKAQA